MTQLYLIRHGIATERKAGENDDLRPLTPKGRQKTTQVAQRLQEMGVHFDLILSSPLIRGHETAQILQNVGLSQEIEIFPPLSPLGNLEDWVNWWSNSCYHKSESCLALVGHEPNLGNWAETLIWGRYEGKLTVKKGGIIGLTLLSKDNPIGNSELHLLTSPKWLI